MNTRTLYAKARAGLAKGDAGNWEAAEAMAELVEQGETQTAIAVELKCNQSTVQRYLKIWDYAGRHNPRPLFADVRAELKIGLGAPRIPQTPEGRTKLAAELLKDKDVYDAPAVQKAVDRNETRRLRQEAAAWRAEHKIPTRTETIRDRRARIETINRSFWRDLLWKAKDATRVLNDGVGELERTGMPNGEAGDIIKAARTLAKAADRFAETAAGHGIGKAMTGNAR